MEIFPRMIQNPEAIKKKDMHKENFLKKQKKNHRKKDNFGKDIYHTPQRTNCFNIPRDLKPMKDK